MKRAIYIVILLIVLGLIGFAIYQESSVNMQNNKKAEEKESTQYSSSEENTSNANNTSSTSSATNTNNTLSTSSTTNENKGGNGMENTDYKLASEKQMAKPEKGEEIAIIHVKDYGQIKVKFFNDVAPKAVENFITHAKDGYYNGVIFHRVINEFMIQGGDPEGTGRGGESIWGKGFGEEFSYELVPYRGTLCMASKGVGSSSLGSQFFITQANHDNLMELQLKQGGYPEGLIEQYKAYGGAMHLYLQYTIFGQVFEGMEIVDKIAKVETNSDDKPNKDVVIEKIEVTVQK